MPKTPYSSYEIEKRIQQDRPYISIDHSTYVNTSTRCCFMDSEYGAWFAKPNDILNGGNHYRRYQNTRLYSSYEIEKRIQQDRPYISIDHSTYVNTHTKCRFIDAEYGEWYATPNNIIKGCGNKKRSILNTKLLPREIENKIQIERPYISIDHSTYKNTSTKCRFIDSEYGEWYATPNSILSGRDHPHRGILKITQKTTLSSYEIERRITQDRPYISIDHSTYVNTGTKCRFIDSEYGEWFVKPNDILMGHENPKRSWQGISIAEKDIANFIKNYAIIKENYRVKVNDKLFELDVFIPEFNIGVEYHGLYWHSETYKTNNYHTHKREFFEKQGIQLLQFYENEWRDNQDIVKSIILSKIGQSEHKYQARKLELKQVNNKDAQLFLKNNHLMGEYKTAKYIGLFDNNELISLLGYKRIKDGIDISRFCNKLNTSVAGSYSKLLKYIEINEKPAFIQSFIDLRYGNGKALEKMGFKLEKVTQGWHWTDYDRIYNRLYCKANMDERKLTEKQHAEELKLHRIYDAGQAKYIKFFIFS